MKSIIKRKNLFCRYVEGPLFPLINGAIVLAGYFSGYEYYGNLLFFSTVILALLFSDSTRPFLTLTLFFIFQVTYSRSPSYPYYSTYYFEGWRLIGVYVLAVGLVLSLLYYVIRTRMFSNLWKNKSALFVPLSLLFFAFALNGVGTSHYETADTVFGLATAGCWVFFYFFLYAGFQKEDPKSLLSFLLECVHVQAWIILTELFYIFFTTPGIFTSDLMRAYIVFGWGTCNSCGVCLAVLVPLCFYGFVEGKYKLFSLVTAVACYVGAVLTLSRNTLLFATLGLIGCLVLGCLHGEKKRRRRFFVFSLLLLVLSGGALYFFRESISAIFESFISRGFEDSGRFTVWKYVLGLFRDNPIFGVGFFGIKKNDYLDYADFFPYFAHNTLVEMAGAMGAIGLILYVYYRIKTAVVLFKKKTFLRTCMILSVAVFLGESLLDVFPFIIYPTFLYSALLAYAELDNKSLQ